MGSVDRDLFEPGDRILFRHRPVGGNAEKVTQRLARI